MPACSIRMDTQVHAKVVSLWRSPWICSNARRIRCGTTIWLVTDSNQRRIHARCYSAKLVFEDVSRGSIARLVSYVLLRSLITSGGGGWILSSVTVPTPSSDSGGWARSDRSTSIARVSQRSDRLKGGNRPVPCVPSLRFRNVRDRPAGADRLRRLQRRWAHDERHQRLVCPPFRKTFEK